MHMVHVEGFGLIGGFRYPQELRRGCDHLCDYRMAVGLTEEEMKEYVTMCMDSDLQFVIRLWSVSGQTVCSVQALS